MVSWLLPTSERFTIHGAAAAPVPHAAARSGSSPAEITKHNGSHLTRREVREPEFSPELGKLHITLGHLHHLKVRDATKPHLAHPTLGELYPTFGALGGDDAPHPFRDAIYELFGRVRHGAALDQLQDHRGEICQPASAPFGFFGICPRINVKSALQHMALSKGRAPDSCILDLGPPGLARLGPSWETHLDDFLQLLVAHHPETPVFAVTQDIYVHRRVAALLTKVGLTERPSAGGPPPSRVIVRSSDDCFAVDPDIGEVTEAVFQFHSAGGQGAAALRNLLSRTRHAGSTDAEYSRPSSALDGKCSARHEPALRPRCCARGVRRNRRRCPSISGEALCRDSVVRDQKADRVQRRQR